MKRTNLTTSGKTGHKAQISSQVFIYVLAAIMIALLLFIGMKAVSVITSAGGAVNIDSLKSDISSSVETASKQYGSVKKIVIPVPGKFDEICFIDAMEEDNKFHFDTAKINNSLIRSSAESGAKENVFLMKNSVWEEKFTADNLDVQTDYLCIENVGKVEIWLRGTGKKALLYTQNE